MLRWVAEPPPGTRRTPPTPPPTRYGGPPRYLVPPRWGFPALPWAANPTDPTHLPAPGAAALSLAGTLVPTLWSTAAVALVAAGAEIWRYTLLLESREGALSAGVVAASDALVGSAGFIAPTLTVLCGILLVLWTLRATGAAAAISGVRPSRPARSVVLGWLVPAINLSVPGSTLAEIEHTALGRPPGTRPRPSPLLRGWWVLWAGGAVFAVVVALWSLRQGVQARADGVVLHAVLDLVAAATAALTAVLVARLTRLLAPVRPTRRELVVAIRPGTGPAGSTDSTPSSPYAEENPSVTHIAPSR